MNRVTSSFNPRCFIFMLCTFFSLFFFFSLLTYEDNVKPYKNVCDAKQMSTDCRSSLHGSSPPAGPGLERGALSAAGRRIQLHVAFRKRWKNIHCATETFNPRYFSQGPFTRQRFQVISSKTFEKMKCNFSELWAFQALLPWQQTWQPPECQDSRSVV